MSYEYKDAAKNALSMVYSLVGFPKEEVQRAQNELDRVYAQAPKADEYEAKAKAFDEIKGYNDRVFEGDLDSFDLSEAVGDIIETYTIKGIIESGEHDA